MGENPFQKCIFFYALLAIQKSRKTKKKKYKIAIYCPSSTVLNTQICCPLNGTTKTDNKSIFNLMTENEFEYTYISLDLKMQINLISFSMSV